MRQCTYCKLYKFESEFYLVKGKLQFRCKTCLSKIGKKDWLIRRKRQNLLYKKRRIEYMKEWIKLFPLNPICEICGIKLQYFSGHMKSSATFDHKKNNLPIKITPSSWLINHPPTTENIKIWKFCNFGILCYRCNSALRLDDRIKWLKQALKYANRKGVRKDGKG